MLTHLILMRHAKSSWDDPDLSDHQRPLNKRGRRAADTVAKALTARGYAPDIIWSSDAARTLETAQRLIRIIPGAQTVLHNPALYHASAPKIMDIIADQAEPEGRIMILAHNPGIGELYTQFTGQHHRFPTGTCAVFRRAGQRPWTDAKAWRAIDLILPRELEGYHS